MIWILIDNKLFYAIISDLTDPFNDIGNNNNCESPLQTSIKQRENAIIGKEQKEHTFKLVGMELTASQTSSATSKKVTDERKS